LTERWEIQRKMQGKTSIIKRAEKLLDSIIIGELKHLCIVGDHFYGKTTLLSHLFNSCGARVSRVFQGGCIPTHREFVVRDLTNELGSYFPAEEQLIIYMDEISDKSSLRLLTDILTRPACHLLVTSKSSKPSDYLGNMGPCVTLFLKRLTLQDAIIIAEQKLGEVLRCESNTSSRTERLEYLVRRENVQQGLSQSTGTVFDFCRLYELFINDALAEGMDLSQIDWQEHRIEADKKARKYLSEATSSKKSYRFTYFKDGRTILKKFTFE